MGSSSSCLWFGNGGEIIENHVGNASRTTMPLQYDTVLVEVKEVSISLTFEQQYFFINLNYCFDFCRHFEMGMKNSDSMI